MFAILWVNLRQVSGRPAPGTETREETVVLTQNQEKTKQKLGGFGRVLFRLRTAVAARGSDPWFGKPRDGQSPAITQLLHRFPRLILLSVQVLSNDHSEKEPEKPFINAQPENSTIHGDGFQFTRLPLLFVVFTVRDNGHTRRHVNTPSSESPATAARQDVGLRFN